MTAIKDIHKESHETYGSPRIALDLGKRSIKCSRPRVARLMQEMGIRAKCAKKFKVTTDSNHKKPIAPNFLDKYFYPDMPFKVWTSDLTYLLTDSGWQYLTLVMKTTYATFEIAEYLDNDEVIAEYLSLPAADKKPMCSLPLSAMSPKQKEWPA